MMNISILSNIVVDKIISKYTVPIQSLGGPASYCSITARKFGFDTTLFTHFGKDLDVEYINYLKKYGVVLNTSDVSSLPTTRFILKNLENDRELILESKSRSIDIERIEKVKTNCWIISPVFDEVSLDLLQYLIKNRGKNEFIMLDPQGYTRAVDSNGKISIKQDIDLPFKKINGIKLDDQEMSCFTKGLQGIDGMNKVHSKYEIDYVLHAKDKTIHLLENDRHYWLNLPKIDTHDPTGSGDILVSSFTCAILKEKDPLWSICFAMGALIAALQTREIGIKKIPDYSAIEENASYYYNIINYEKV